MNLPIPSLCLPLALALSLFAGAQTPVAKPAAPVLTDAEKTFARSLIPMTLEQATTAIAQADKSQATAAAAMYLRSLANDSIKQPETELLLVQKGLLIVQKLDDPLLAGDFFLRETDAYRDMDDLDGEIAADDRSIAAYEAANAPPQKFGRAYGGRGRARMLLGDFDGSEQDFRIAIADFQKDGDDIGMARMLNNLGNTEHALGHDTEARELYEQGLVLARKHQERLGEAFLLNNIADTYLQEDNTKLATDYCLQSIKIKEELGDQTSLVTSLVNLTRIYQDSKQFDLANKTIERAHTLAEASGRAPLIALTLSEWGAIEGDQYRFESSLEKLRQGLALTEKSDDRMHKNEMSEQIAETELHMHRPADAVRDSTEVLAFARQMGSWEDTSTSTLTIGLAEMELKDFDKARAAFTDCIDATERMREEAAGGDQSRSEFFSHHAVPYQALASLDASQGRWEDALLISEREKGRSLLDLLTQGRTNLSRELTPDEKSEEMHLHIHLSELETQRTKAASVASPDAAHLAALDQQLAASQTAISLFRERMYSIHPEMRRHRGDAEAITLQQAGALLPSASTAIVEYEVTPNATYLFVITRGPSGPVLHGYTIAITSAALSKRVRQFQTALATRDPEYAVSARSLYRLLLAPAQTDLAAKQAIVVVPDGDLWHLPFQALQTTAGKFLLERAAISYAPSLSVLQAYAAQALPSNPGHSLLALGDPGGDLPQAAHEVKALAQLYGSGNSRAFTGAAATKEAFQAGASTYTVIHLATHGVFDDRNPMYSHLLLASSDTASAKGAIAQLDASEIADMKINTSLVVLSACETADGTYQDNEGLIGLSWSFLAAGSQSVVASQWHVESASTTSLMINFHRALQDQMSKAAALRRAELSLARDPKYQHPFYWAGFVLLGSP